MRSFRQLLRHIASMRPDNPVAAELSGLLHEPHRTNGGQAAQSVQAVQTRAIARQQRRMAKEARRDVMLARAQAKRAWRAGRAERARHARVMAAARRVMRNHRAALQWLADYDKGDAA